MSAEAGRVSSPVDAPEEHDERCEAEFITGPMAYSPCGCAERASGRVPSPHGPLYGRQNGLHAYACTCGWSTFDFDTEVRAWSSFREHHRAETGMEPTEGGREVRR